MAARQEREVITEFLEIYSNFPCLWDIGSDQYKDRNLKTQAWECLAKKIREIEPSADVKYAKKKIQFMRTAYKREEKKIKKSRLTAAEPKDVHVPILWYFNLLRPVFNSTKDEESRAGVDTFTSDKDTQPSQTEKKRGAIKRYTNCSLKQKKRKLTRTTAQEEVVPELRKDKKLNTFGLYVGEQLEKIDKLQRLVAEKLISDVLFLAKTGNLHYDSKIETPTSRAPRSLSNNISPSHTPSPQYIVPSLLSTESSVSSPPHYIRLTPSPKSIRSPSPQNSDTSQTSTTTKRDENVDQISFLDVNSLHSSTLIEKQHPSTTMSNSYNSPAPLLQYILSSSQSSNHIQPPPTHSSSQTVTTRNVNEEKVQPELAESEPSLYTEPTKETQTSTSVQEGLAKSLLAELLIMKKAK